MRISVRSGWMTVLASVVFGVVLLLGFENRAFATGTIDDWWLCVENCGDEDAGCVDACTDEYNKSHTADPIRSLKLKTKLQYPGRGAVASSLAARCPAGSVLSPFDMPIYDADGLFVVGLESVWVCVPLNLEPAG